MAVQPVGMVGLGLLGSAIAERLLNAGFTVIGFDVNAEQREQFVQLGGEAAQSVGEVAKRCQRILLSLPNSQVVGTVLQELSPTLQAETVILDTTTGSPEDAESFADGLEQQNCQYIDATVGGSSAEARQGEVIVMAGGDPAVIEANRDLFECFSRAVYPLGRCGNGARMKLVMNLVLGLNRAVLAEGLAYARACGLNPDDALEILQAGPTYSRVMDSKGKKMLDEEFTPVARLSQHLKDVRLIIDQGEQYGAHLPFSLLHRCLLEELESAGFGDADNSAIIRGFD